MNVLHIDSSILGDHSTSRLLGQEIVAAWRTTDPGVAVTYRDVGTEVIPVLDPQVLGAAGLSEDQRTPFQQAQAELSRQLLAELFAADTLLIAAPMYNFSIPAGLRAWFDRVLVAGTTFRYTANGPEGLLRGKKAVLVLTAGGLHSHTPVNQMHEGYLRTLLGFIGIEDVTVVRAEGLNLGGEARERGLAAAREAIEALVATEAA